MLDESVGSIQETVQSAHLSNLVVAKAGKMNKAVGTEASPSNGSLNMKIASLLQSVVVGAASFPADGILAFRREPRTSFRVVNRCWWGLTQGPSEDKRLVGRIGRVDLTNVWEEVAREREQGLVNERTSGWCYRLRFRRLTVSTRAVPSLPKSLT